MNPSSLSSLARAALLAAGVSLVSSPQAAAQGPGTVLQTGKISSFLGAFTGDLSDQDQFGSSVASIGDLNGDGIDDLVVGASFDDDGVNGAGAVWILFMTDLGTVSGFQKISQTEGNFGGAVSSFDRFGASVAGIGDVDGDGIPDIAVGAPLDDEGGDTAADNYGAVWILRLDTDGTVLAEQKIAAESGGFDTVFGNDLDDGSRFGSALAAYGDVNGDGRPELVVGAEGDEDGGFASDDRGAVYILTLATDLTVSGGGKISEQQGNFSFGGGSKLKDFDRFGASVAVVGDLNLDGVGDLAVGMPGRDDGGTNHGGLYLLLMAPDFTVRESVLISPGEGGFFQVLDDNDALGSSLAGPGDLNGDSYPDLVVGAPGDDDVAGGGVNGGALWVMFLGLDGVLLAEQKISDLEGGFVGSIGSDDRLGTSLGVLPADTANGIPKVLTGAIGDDDGGGSGATSDRGAVWLLTLDGTPGTSNWQWTADGIAGTDGFVPTLGGDGPLTFQSTTTVRMYDALPGGICTLLISTVAVDLPFKGGTLVPLPTISTGFVLGDDGFLELAAEMPEDVPIGIPIYLQIFIGDPGAVQGFSSTNGLVGMRP